MNLAATSFDLGNARECAALASAAYHIDAGLLSAPIVSSRFIFSTATDTQVIVIEFADYIAVFFRGTTNLRDVVTDGQILRVKFLTGELHGGVSRALESVIVELREAILDMPRHKPLVIGGHSLGGGIAAPFAYEWEMEYRGFLVPGRTVTAPPMQPIHSVYTFGKLREFDASAQYAYNAALRERTYRVVNCADPVPLLPGLLSGYLHEGQEIFLRTIAIRPDGLISTPKCSVWLTQNPSRLWEMFWDARSLRFQIQRGDFGFLRAAEHHIEFYRAQLDRVCDAA